MMAQQVLRTAGRILEGLTESLHQGDRASCERGWDFGGARPPFCRRSPLLRCEDIITLTSSPGGKGKRFKTMNSPFPKSSSAAGEGRINARLLPGGDPGLE